MPEITTYTTTDGVQTAITKGGEQIANNTYGFEIEFCSHDSSVFAFTHVDAVTFQITLNGDTAEWKVESDSGNVLELVTSPLTFGQVDDAYTFKVALAGALTDSMAAGLMPGLNALAMSDWVQRSPQTLQQFLQIAHPGAQVVWRYRTWAEVGQQLNVENIDDGINIRAALYRHRVNQGTDAWTSYVGSTVLCRSEKDWGVGYSSQVNMPMTLAGYFLYVTKTKLPRSLNRFTQIIEMQTIGGLADSTLTQRVTTWFWSTLIAEVCMGYLQISGLYNGDIRMLNPALLSIEQLNQASFVYLMTSKILTGALGSLSEPYQLKLQQLAWEQRSTQAMVNEGTESYQEMLRSRQIETKWLEYHSSMKDLTGLWFKGALLDVLCSENISAGFARLMAQTLRTENAAVWDKMLAGRIHIMADPRWDPLWDQRQGYADDLGDLDRVGLVAAIRVVAAALAAELDNYATWRTLNPQQEASAFFQLPPRPQRPFLHYGQPLWEGRYDTMIAAIPNLTLKRWTYLVEHRFN